MWLMIQRCSLTNEKTLKWWACDNVDYREPDQTHESSGCGVRSTKPTAGLLVLMKGLLSFTPWNTFNIMKPLKQLCPSCLFICDNIIALQRVVTTMQYIWSHKHEDVLLTLGSSKIRMSLFLHCITCSASWEDKSWSETYLLKSIIHKNASFSDKVHLLSSLSSKSSHIFV